MLRWPVDLRLPSGGGFEPGNRMAIRAALASRNIRPVIPDRAKRRVKIDHDRELYRRRNQIERFFGRLKINRAIAARYDQLAEASYPWSTSPPADACSNLSMPPSSHQKGSNNRNLSDLLCAPEPLTPPIFGSQRPADIGKQY